MMIEDYPSDTPGPIVQIVEVEEDQSGYLEAKDAQKEPYT